MEMDDRELVVIRLSDVPERRCEQLEDFGNRGRPETGLRPHLSEYVYFIMVDTDLWKIGRSVSLKRPRRLASKTAGAVFFHVIPTNSAVELESAVHASLKEYRIDGSEVFRCSVEEVEGEPYPVLRHWLQKRCYIW